MAVYREEKSNTWRAVYRYTDWTGERKQTQKRGFTTKREAIAWEREQLVNLKQDLDMTFESFFSSYTADMQSRLKENTWRTKENIIRNRILPYFGKRKMSEIRPGILNEWYGCLREVKQIYGKSRQIRCWIQWPDS